MDLERLDPAAIRSAISAVENAHRSVSQESDEPETDIDDPEHWQGMLEANAAAVLAALDEIRIADGYVVRYRFFERTEGDLKVRPFAARSTTDVTAVRSVLEWHPPPDSGIAAQRPSNRDAELLYQHFSFEPTAIGVFQYWMAMQEIWASAEWVHTRVVTGREDFAEIVSSGEWQVEQELETHQPAVLRNEDGAHLAVLLYSPLRRHSIVLQQVEIRADKTVAFAAPITVASGPRGYIA